MSVYPYNLTPEGAPTDQTGSYPNVAGYTPMSTGRRVAVAAVDVVIAWLFAGIMGVAIAQEQGWSIPVAVGAYVVHLLLALWALFGRSARVAGLLMKAQYVDVRTGRLAPGGLLLKQLLQMLLLALTLGIAPLIIWFASVRGPMRRNWFDRVTKLMLVDGRSGRTPGQPPIEPDVPEAVSHVAPVQFNPEASPTPWSGQASSPYEFPAVQPVTSDGGLITAVPGRPRSEPATPHRTPDGPVPVERSVAHEPRRARRSDGEASGYMAPLPDHTVLAPSALEGVPEATRPEVVLDDAHPLHVSPALVIGRNPVPPGSHHDAVPYRVDDALVSKTHLLLGRDDESVWVIDLNSTNGVEVSTVPDQPVRPITSGRRVRLPEGSVVQFGQHRITVG